ncbi:hypothetical protein RIF29_28404 [Crotalaria pallida]|uniref:Uncharacterized protein n=1 Tax=Crotalaria pallida TaxID=3830 RepID=A0AAN9EEQ8_CROPI
MSADTVVSFLLDNLTQLLTSEVNRLYGVEGKVKLLKQELERIQGFLKDSEGKREEHEAVKAVINQIKDVSYEAEDVIDNYVLEADIHARKNMLARFIDFGYGKMLHSVDNQIEKIKERIKDIYDNKDTYGIKEGESEAAKAKMEEEAARLEEKVHKRRTDVEEDDVVGFDGYADQVMKLLVEGDTSLQVVSIVGMVGLGKTTLARKLYKDPRTKKQFADCCLWEFVTQKFSPKELLVNLLKSVNEIDEGELKKLNKNNNNNEKAAANASSSSNNFKEIDLELEFLKNKLKQYLSEMKYLIVLDDMWSSQVLEEIGDAFPNDNMGSRILITTRFEQVASNSKIPRSQLYKLGRLSEEDSWTLLSKRVFVGENCPPGLEATGMKIATACKGLPLSIVVIAGILRSKEKSERVWEKVVGNVNWYIKEEDQVVKEIVKLSYDTLPPKYKPCFLYFGIYPEDYDVPARQLIQLWVAEGFIPTDDKMAPEDVAEEYLEELVRRNLIQVECRRTDGGVKTCRIHDLLRELCIAESKGDNFLEVRTDINILKEGKPRRLSLHCSTSHYMVERSCDHSSTRSLFSFGKDEDFDSDDTYATWLQDNFKLIRVLDMGQVKGSRSAIGRLGDLVHLRYIRAREDRRSLCTIPKSVINLWNLETLDLRACDIRELPDKMWKMEQLRHIHMSGTGAKLPDIPGKKSLRKLQTLSIICLDKKARTLLENGKFPNLRKLGLGFLHGDMNIEDLQKLQCLKHLSTLKVIHANGVLSSAQGLPPNITKITLVSIYCLNEAVAALASLPKLRYLKITGNDALAFAGLNSLKLECNSEGYKQLQVLKLKDLEIVSWKLGQGAMPLLRRLVINKCNFSTTLTTDQPLTTLQEVEVLWSSEEVADMLQHLVVKDACKFTIYGASDE